MGGHTHDLLAEGDRNQGVPIAQAGCFAKHLGRIRLEVDDAGVRVTSTPGWPSRSATSLC